ncbi:MAG: GlmU family protein [Calditrichia bacterium]
MKILLFEDEGFRNLLPLVYLRPVWELRCGAYLLIEKIRMELPEHAIYLSAREYLEKYYFRNENAKPGQNEEVLLLNGRLLAKTGDGARLLSLASGESIVSDESLIAARLKFTKLADYMREGVLQTESLVEQFSPVEKEFQLIRYPWDLIEENGRQIRMDWQRAELKRDIEGSVDEGALLLQKEDIYIGRGARVMPGAVLNAEKGPVWLDEGALVMPNAVLEGPVYVGPQSRIKTGAKIYEDTSVGPVCKVGGEVESVIFHSFSNKQHDGFLGHSVLGSWINIGADTNNSDLKNNYGPVSVSLNGRQVETGKQFLGLIMGDHSKTAINTMFNTGTIVGMHCNVFGAGFPPKFLPSFTWGGSGGMRNYRFEKAIEVARIVMARRSVEFTDNLQKLFEEAGNLANQIEKRERVRG